MTKLQGKSDRGANLGKWGRELKNEVIGRALAGKENESFSCAREWIVHTRSNF
jgi:hypothetical protein